MSRTIPCPKCHGRGHLEVDDPEAPCEAAIVVGSEPPITCYASRQHPGQPHMAILAQPCSACGQYEEHDETCAVYLVEPSEGASYPICWWAWEDGDLAPRRVDDEVGRTWRDHYQPDSPHARVVAA